MLVSRRAQPIYRLADIIGIADISVLACGSLTCADVKTVFKAVKNAWTSDLKWRHCIVYISSVIIK